MIVKEYSTWLNSLAKYAFEVASMVISRMEIFIHGLRFDNAQDMMMGNYTPNSHTKSLRH